MATKTVNKTERRISYLRSLIEHPRTSETEREAAKRALKRVLDSASYNAEQQSEAKPSMPSWYNERVYGAKYASISGTWMTAADIAKLVRADIKLAMKAARAEAKEGDIAIPDPLTLIPADVKITVKTESFSGGRSIDVIMRNIPQDWGYSTQEDRWTRNLCEMPSPELKAAAKALKAILNAYNYDGSSPEVDYYDVNYYGHVENHQGLLLA